MVVRQENRSGETYPARQCSEVIHAGEEHQVVADAVAFRRQHDELAVFNLIRAVARRRISTCQMAMFVRGLLGVQSCWKEKSRYDQNHRGGEHVNWRHQETCQAQHRRHKWLRFFSAHRCCASMG